MKIVYKFSGQFCTPCKLMVPAWKAVKSLLHDKAKFIEVDIEEETELVEKMNILNVPTFIVCNDGKEIARVSGMITKEKLEKFVLESN